jgi:hypothetical protein
MKFSLITLIRNEQDILNTFLNHVDALFDEVYLVNHRSLDNTACILKSAVKQRSGWHYFALDLNAHYQKEVSNLLIQHAFNRGANFVFFQDCDEFLQVKDRADSDNQRIIDSQLVEIFVGSIVSPISSTVRRSSSIQRFGRVMNHRNSPRCVSEIAV